jgi:hypothetical protein
MKSNRTPKPTPKFKPRPFTPPEMKVGQSVYFYHGKTYRDDPNVEPHLALVVKVNPGGVLELAHLPPDMHNFKLYDSPTRHVDDPLALRDIENDSEAGVWDVNPHCLTNDEVGDLRVLLSIFKAEIDTFKKQLEVEDDLEKDAELEAAAGVVPVPAAA